MTLLEMPMVADLHTTRPLSADKFARVRRHMQLNCCKWDSQLGDSCTLADFALVISAECWAQLSHWAEQLAQETFAAQKEIRARPQLWPALDLPARWRACYEAERPRPGE